MCIFDAVILYIPWIDVTFLMCWTFLCACNQRWNVPFFLFFFVVSICDLPSLHCLSRLAFACDLVFIHILLCHPT